MKHPQAVGWVLCALSVGAGVAAGVLAKSYTTGDTTKESCEEDNNYVDKGSSCGVWQVNGGPCRKGTVDGEGECISKPLGAHLEFLLPSIACLLLCCAAGYFCIQDPDPRAIAPAATAAES